MAAIVTLTANPAIDLSCVVPVLEPTHKLRVPGYEFDPGGGGVNVARVLHALGSPVLALLLLGGDIGAMLGHLLDRDGVPWRGIDVAGTTRISIVLHEDTTGREYRVVPAGPPVTAAEWQQALAELARLAPRWVVASGSLAPGLPATAYAQLAAFARGIGASCALDTSGDALLAARGQGLDLIKLSLCELAHLSGRHPRRPGRPPRRQWRHPAPPRFAGPGPQHRRRRRQFPRRPRPGAARRRRGQRSPALGQRRQRRRGRQPRHRPRHPRRGPGPRRRPAPLKILGSHSSPC